MPDKERSMKTPLMDRLAKVKPQPKPEPKQPAWLQRLTAKEIHP